MAARASAAMGAALLRAIVAAFGAEMGGPRRGGVAEPAAAALAAMKKASRPVGGAAAAAARPKGHLAVVFGAAVGSLAGPSNFQSIAFQLGLATRSDPL